MSILTEPLRNEVIINGVGYKVNPDFRIVLRCANLSEEGTPESILEALTLFYEVIPPNVSEAVKAFTEFVSGEGKGSKERVFDFDFDADYVFSAFLSTYGIDLNDIPFLHWRKFIAMFSSLKGTALNDRINDRAIKIDSKMSKAEQAYYRKRKSDIKLPPKKTKKVISDEEKAIINGTFEGARTI